MAIINSLAIGKSVKSAGNLTYKTIRGRTIASQRITTNKSKTLAQVIQRNGFGAASRSAALIQTYIKACYEKSKYGSARNAFMRINKDYKAFGLIPEVREGAIPLVDVFIPAFASDPASNGDYIEWATYGTSPVIVREIFAPAVFTDSSSNTSIYNNTSRVEYSFIKPVPREKARIVMCGLIGDATNGLAKTMLTTRDYTLADLDITSLGEMGFHIDVNEDTNGDVLSFAVSIGTPTFSGEYEAYAVIFPVVDGKIPKLKGWLHTDVEPAP